MFESSFIRGFVLLIGLIGFGATTTTPTTHKPANPTAMDGPGGMLPPCLPSQGSCGIM